MDIHAEGDGTNLSSRNLGPTAPAPPFHPSNLVEDLNTVLEISCKDSVTSDSVKFEFGPQFPGSVKLIQHNSHPWEFTKQGCTSVDKYTHHFCTLVYSEGKRYTFGNKLVKRESQEEYVLLGDTMGKVKESLFYLQCEDGELWISILFKKDGDTSFQNSVHLNGILLGKDQRKPMYFGDIISIYSTIEATQSYDFVFTLKYPHAPEEVGVNSDMDVDFVTFPALAAPLILYNILTFLPIKKLKALRHVSRLWSQEALKVLSGRNGLTLTVSVFNRATSLNPDEMAQISNLASAFPHCVQFRCWKLDVPNFQHNEGVELGAIMQNMKLLHDLESLVLLVPFRVTQLHMFLGLSSTSQALLASLFGAVASSLVSLHLVMGMDFELEWNESSVKLPVLHKLWKLDWRPSKTWNTKTLPLIHSLVACCPQLTNPHLPFAGFLKKETPGFSGEVVKKMAGSQLAELSIDCSITPELTFEVLKTFSSISTGLRKLELFDLMMERRGRQTILIQEILDAWGGTLEELTLWYYDMGFEEDDPQYGIQMAFPPTLRKLEKLSIFVRVDISYYGTGDNDNGGEEDFCVPRPFFSFGDTRQSYMDYSRFPSLRQLTLGPRSHPFADHGEDPLEFMWRKNPSRKISSSFSGENPVRVNVPSGMENWKRFESMASPFLRNPRNGSSLLAPEVHNVDIPFQLNDEYHSMLDSLETVFPDCNFPEELQEARALDRFGE